MEEVVVLHKPAVVHGLLSALRFLSQESPAPDPATSAGTKIG